MDSMNHTNKTIANNISKVKLLVVANITHVNISFWNYVCKIACPADLRSLNMYTYIHKYSY